MKISVIIPVYNGERHLAACLDSVRSSTLPAAEVLVVDDGSTDATAQVVASFGQVRYLHQQHGGASAARNRGIAEATQEWLAFLDADDMMTSQRLRLQSKFLQAHPKLDGVFGEVEQFSDPPDAYLCDQGRQLAKLPGTLLVRADIFRRVGGFDVGYRVGEFVDWALRAEEGGVCFGAIPELVLQRRIHANNSGRLLRHARQDYAKVVMAAVRRRRCER